MVDPCQICSEPYDLERRIARILSACGHTICEICALEIIRGTGVQCPFDRKVTHVIDGNVKYLKKDYVIQEKIWELLYANNRILDDKEYEAERSLGIPCAENESHVAVLYCLKCEAHYCQRCSKTTHNSKSFLSHKMLKVTEKPQPVIHCYIHEKNLAELYCQDEECEVVWKVMCASCRLFGVHKGHKYTTLDNICRENLKESFDLLDQTSAEIAYIKYHIESIGEIPDRLENSQEYIDAKNEIHETYNRQLVEYNDWKTSEMQMLTEQIEQKIELKKTMKNIKMGELRFFESEKKELSAETKRKKAEFFEEFANSTMLGQMEVLSGAGRGALQLMDMERNKKIIFVHMMVFEGPHIYSVRGKDLVDKVEEEGFWDLTMLKIAVRELLENTTLVFLLNFEHILECNENISSCKTIIFGHRKQVLMEIGLYENFVKDAERINVPIFFCEREDARFLEYIRAGNYEGNSFFEPLRKEYLISLIFVLKIAFKCFEKMNIL